MNTNEPKIASDVVESEFSRFIEFNAIDADTKTMNQEEQADFAKLKRLITTEMGKGNLIVGTAGEVIYTPYRSTNKDNVIFSDPRGSAMLAMDRKKKGEDIGKLYSAMADMCKIEPKIFASMHLADVKVCTAVATLFLA